jgi:hypothetical protein
MSVSCPTVARELTVLKLYFMGVQEVRWDKEGTVRAGDYIFTLAKEANVINWEQEFCISWNSISS